MDITHTKLLLVVAIAAVPALIQAIWGGYIHWVWLAFPVLAGIFAVVMW